jgi:chromosome segregation ATPase
MPTVEDRVGALELRVEHMVTWAGPGQAEALSVSTRQTRADLAKIQRIQVTHSRQLTQLTADLGQLTTEVTDVQRAQADHSRQLTQLTADLGQLTTDVAVLKADVAGLTADMIDVKASLREILQRLPPAV